MSRHRPQVILHIGRHKSGTSTLQNRFAACADDLKRQGVIYPALFRMNKPQHHPLADLLKRGTAIETVDAQRAAFLEEVDGYDRVILSSEALQGLQHPDHLRRFFEGFDLHVIAYLREFLAYAASSWAQAVHFQNTSVDFAYFTKHFVVDLRAFRTFWQGVADQTHFVLYERGALTNGDIVADFCQRFGIDPPPETEVDFNPSLAGNLLYFKIISNLIGASSTTRYRAVLRLAQNHSHFRGRFAVAPELQEQIRRQPYNRHLARIVGREPQQLDYTAYPPVFRPESWAADLDIIASDAELAPQVDRVRQFARQLDGQGFP